MKPSTQKLPPMTAPSWSAWVSAFEKMELELVTCQKDLALLGKLVLDMNTRMAELEKKDWLRTR